MTREHSSMFWFQKALVNQWQRPKLAEEQLSRAAQLERQGS